MPAAFVDRIDAGLRLARELPHDLRDPLVLGIPRGGVVVARAVADELHAELDVMVVHKLGAPGNPELAIGALGPDGTIAFDERVMRLIGSLPAMYVEREAAAQRAEIQRRTGLYRRGRGPLRVEKRACILVDDGVATGATARAAMLWLRARGASPLVFGCPVAPAATARVLETLADQLVCLLTPPDFLAVGQWYDEFGQVTDEEVVTLLGDGGVSESR